MKRILIITLFLMACGLVISNSVWPIPPFPPKTGAGTGDMSKATYDTNSNNVVDTAATASALAADPADCAAGSVATAIAASGALTCGKAIGTDIQTELSILKGTYTNGYLCKYTSSGTLLDCNVDPAGFQTADADLAAIAALSCTENQIIKMNGAGAWVCAADANDGGAAGSIATDTLWDAKGDLVVGTGSNTGGKLAVGTAYQILHTNTDTPGWTSTLGATGTRLTAGFFTDLTVTNAIAGGVTGNAGTATALAADPADCAAGQVATGIAASGALSCTATPSVTTLTGAVTGVASGNIANTLADAAGDMIYASANDTWAKLTKGTEAQMLVMGASIPAWSSTLSITGIDLTAGTFNMPNGTTALNTGAGRIYFNTTSKAFSIGDGSSSYYAPTSLAPLSFTTGGTTARTMTLPNADATLLYSGGALGTPSGGTLTNATGLPIATGISGLGTGVATGLAVNIGSAGAPVLFNGAGGTPSSLNLSNAVTNSGTSLPGTCTVGQLFLDTDADTNGSVYSCVAANTWKDIDDDGGAGGMATTDIDTSSEVLGIVTDETGSASGTPLLVFNQAPRLDNIELGAATDTTIARSAAGVVTIEGATILTNTVPSVVDGHAAANLTAASMSDPRCSVTNYGQSAEDVAVTLPTAAANLSCLFNVGTAQSGNKWGVRAGTNDKIYLIAAAGTIGVGSDNGYARMTAAQVGQSFACWSFTTGSGAYDWQCKAIAIGSSTFAAN